jgi:hypothetical protein
MRRVCAVSTCVVAVLATAAVGATVAWAEPPDFGRCVKVAKGTGVYATPKCTEAGGERKFEWIPGPGPKAGFSLGLMPETHFLIESAASRTKLVCTGGGGAGEIAGPTSISSLTLTLTGCERAGIDCESEGRPPGEIALRALNGTLGVVKRGETPQRTRLACRCRVTHISYAMRASSR